MTKKEFTAEALLSLGNAHNFDLSGNTDSVKYLKDKVKMLVAAAIECGVIDE